jgi:hypothetical protein
MGVCGPLAGERRDRFQGHSGRASGEAARQLLTDAVEKGFSGGEQIFSEAPVQSSENDVGRHIISPISNQQPS